MALPCMCTSVCNCDEEGAFTPPRAADGVKEQVMSRVLVVDDDPQILRMLQMWLEREGHEVFLAEDGHDALNIVDWAPDCIDLMITDIVMPEKEGLEPAARRSFSCSRRGPRGPRRYRRMDVRDERQIPGRPRLLRHHRTAGRAYRLLR